MAASDSARGSLTRAVRYGHASPRTVRWRSRPGEHAHAPPGDLIVEYRVTSRAGGKPVDFDGCAVDRPGHPLLDAKYGYTDAFQGLDAGKTWAEFGVVAGLAKQAGRQADITSRSHPVEWHASEATMVPKMADQQQKAATGPAPNMTVVHTPAIAHAD